MPGCSVPYCHRRAEQGIRLFVFPKDQKRRQLWTQLCNREDRPPPKHARMCEYHFEDDQFVKDSSRAKRKLKSNAIPTIFDSQLTLRKVYVSLKSRKKKKFSFNINDIKPEFVDVSEQGNESFWKNEVDFDSLMSPFDENNFYKTNHEENVDPMEDFSQNNNFENSNTSIEHLCVEPEFPIDGTIDSEDILKLNAVDNICILNRTKVLERQLKEKDEELQETKSLLSKTLKQVERLKALNDKFQTQISELSGKSKSKCYSSSRRKKSRRTKRS